MIGLSRLMHAISDVPKGGMQTGSPKVVLKLADAERITAEFEGVISERDALSKEVDAANERIGELQNALVDDASAKVMLKEMSIENEGINLTAEGNIFHIFCEAFVKAFQESTAKNYLVMEFFNSELGPFTVTMQRSNGLTVHQKLKASEAERDALAAQVEFLRSSIDKYQALGDECILREALTKTPQQCLRDVKAEAGRAGYLQGHEDSMMTKFDGFSKELADEYAARVRQGGAK